MVVIIIDNQDLITILGKRHTTLTNQGVTASLVQIQSSTADLYGFAMLKRDLETELRQLMAQYPVTTLMGPRQSGKTTLVRAVFPEKPYYNLEEPDTRQIIEADPRSFFQQHPSGMILDEIQKAPELISYIQAIVDEKRQCGMFILTGSHQFHLHQAVTQSLAGRTGILELLPFSIHELQASKIELTADEYLLTGFLPAIYDRQIDPTTAYRNYVRTYVERDVRQLINIKDMHAFQRFIQLTAGRIGSICNVESLANDVGVSANTVKSWLSLLEASYLLYQLQPYYENFGKRIIKSPKIYFTDVGMACYLLNIENKAQLSRDRLRGGLFENLVLLELVKTRLNQGKEPYFYYYRDNHQNEVDIIIKHGQYLIPVEIKSTATFNPALLKNIHFYQTLVGEKAPIGFLVYAGDYETQIGNIHIINFRHSAEILDIIGASTATL